MTSYKKLKQIFHEAALSSDIAGILHWDMSTMMPKNSRENRAEQLAYLSKIRHQLISSTNVGKLIDQAKITRVWYKGTKVLPNGMNRFMVIGK